MSEARPEVRDPIKVAAEKARRAAALARDVSAAAGPGGGAGRFVVVRLGRERAALPVDAVQGIHRCPPLTPLPGAPPFVAGVAALAGLAVTVIDLPALLGAALDEETPAAPRVVVVRHGGDPVALRVDAVEAVRPLGDLRPAPLADASWLRPDQALGIAEGTIPAIDIARVLGDPRLVVDTPTSEERSP